MTERSVHRGPCVECARLMVDQREWNRNPRVRPGRAKVGGYGRCGACYIRGRRHGTLPSVLISPYTLYLVECDQCGPIAEEAISRLQATRVRGEHLQLVHGIRTSSAMTRRASE